MMCEYCGCQAVAAIAELTREHERALDHVRAAEQAAMAGNLAAALEAGERLQQVLLPHNVVEERGLFPAMAREFPEQVGTLEDEHREIEQALLELHGQPTPEAWSVRLLIAMEALREHILKEQDGVFPAALSSLRAGDWQLIDETRSSLLAVPS
jgi:hemerythrin-like domain-containing protein